VSIANPHRIWGVCPTKFFVVKFKLSNLEARMLSKRQNFLETIRGGKPDRFVNQYEFLSLLMKPGYVLPDPINGAYPSLVPGGPPVTGVWGVTMKLDEGQPGPMPLHDDAHKVLKKKKKWEEVVKMPRTDYPDSAWEESAKMAQEIDRNETFVTAFYLTGVFERLHYLMGMEDCMVNFYEEPGLMRELIEYVTEYELKFAAEITKHWKPDALFHHDDWGTQVSSFMSPEMFREFIKPAYKKIYSFYKSNGVEILIHHSDSYAANLVPDMIDLGVDVFQGCTSQNNVPELVKKYGGKISFMGDLNNGVLDRADWTPELIHREVERACRTNGKLYYIPCLTMGGPGSSYPGVYEAVTEEIDKMSKEMF
jgi:uroporphyrinogen-III decarboxylase